MTARILRRSFVILLTFLGTTIAYGATHGEASEDQELIINHPRYDADRYERKSVEDAQGHPEIGNLNALLVFKDEDAVCLYGPSFESQHSHDFDELFHLESPRIEKITRSANGHDRLRVSVNPRLSYEIDSLNEAFEDHATVARFKLIRDDPFLVSQFVFIGTGDGGGPTETRIQIFVDGGLARESAVPFTIESRDRSELRASQSAASVPNPTRNPTPSPVDPAAGRVTSIPPGCFSSESREALAVSGLAVIGVALAFVAAGLILAANRVPSVRRFAHRLLPIVPLFSRVEKPRAFDHVARSGIMASLELEPGLHFRELQRRVGLSRGALEHHLKKLLELGFITAQSGTRYTCYFPKGTVNRSVMTAFPRLKAPGARMILAEVVDQPGISPPALAAASGMTLPGVHYHVHRLEAAGLLRITRGQRFQLFATPTGVTALSQAS